MLRTLRGPALCLAAAAIVAGCSSAASSGTSATPAVSSSVSPATSATAGSSTSSPTPSGAVPTGATSVTTTEPAPVGRCGRKDWGVGPKQAASNVIPGSITGKPRVAVGPHGCYERVAVDLSTRAPVGYN